MKKIMSLILAMTIVMATLLVGCGAKENTDTKEVTKDTPKTEVKEEQPVDQEKEWTGTIKVQMIGNWKLDDATDPLSGETTKGVHVLKEEFEKTHPGATVEFVLMGWDSYTQKTQAMLMSGEADVYQVPGIASLAAQGLLDPLAPYIEKDNYDLNNYIDGQVDGWKAKGPEDKDLEIYGLPVLGDTRVIVYDKQLFDDWGVEYLSENPTMKEILEKAKKMTGKNPVTGEENFGIFYKGKDAADTLMNLAEANGGTWGSGFEWDGMKINFNSEEMKSGLNWLKEAVKYAPEGALSNQGGELFLKENNNIAISLRESPLFVKSMYSVGVEDRFIPAKLFVNEKEGMGGLFAGSPYSIGKDGKNKDLAWEYLKFTGSEFYQQYLWDEYMFIPNLKSAKEWDSIKSVPAMEVLLESMGTLWAPRYPYRSGQPRSILSANVENALLGVTSVDEALETAQKEADDWLIQQN